MKMGNNVAKTGQIDLVWRKGFLKCTFNGKYDMHQPVTIRSRKRGHFTDMLAEYDAAESGIISVSNANNTTKLILPKKLASGRFT